MVMFLFKNNLLDCLFDVLGLNTIVDDLLGNLLGYNLVGGLLGGGSSGSSSGSYYGYTVGSSSGSTGGSVVVDKPIFNPVTQILTCPVILDVDVDLGCLLSVDLDVLLFSSSNVLVSQVIPVSFSGIAGEIAYVDIDLHGLDLDADLILRLGLLNLHLDLDLDLDLNLCDIQLFNFVDGLLTTIVVLVDQLLDGLLG
jgi:hypothetical protein